MANPNRVFANMSKNPWTHVKTVASGDEADKLAEQMAAEGAKVKVTSFKVGPRPSFRNGKWTRQSYNWNVWKVES